uniref:Uncharacterized protein n=1 Tax=Tanacetum cinerariifolium TaxID=118510 RepID=A0A699GYK8_TANCI|nr:hypothetical protein [Tanacetum cinerariifolium]
MDGEENKQAACVKWEKGNVVFVYRSSLLCDFSSSVFTPSLHQLKALFGGVTDWYQEPRLWLFFILISLVSSADSAGTSIARVILFGTIPTTIPPTTPTTDLPVIYDDTLPTPIISPILPTIPPVALLIQYTSPFIDTDTPDSSPLHDPYEAADNRFLLVDLIVPNTMGVLKMLTARKSVESLPTHRLASRYLSDSSSLDQFTSDDSSRDSPSDPSLETLSDSHSDTSSNSSSRHSSLGYAISETRCDSPTATSERPSRKRCRTPIVSVPIYLPVRKALSPIRADLLPPPKRIRDSVSVTNLDISSEDGYEPYVRREADIDECIAYADTIRARGMDDKDVVETATAKEVESSARGTIEAEVDPRVRLVVDYDVRESVREDVPDHVIADGAVKVTYKTLGDLLQRFHDHAVEIPVHWIQVIESV